LRPRFGPNLKLPGAFPFRPKRRANLPMPIMALTEAVGTALHQVSSTWQHCVRVRVESNPVYWQSHAWTRADPSGCGRVPLLFGNSRWDSPRDRARLRRIEGRRASD
jgi:hypothetical protein